MMKFMDLLITPAYAQTIGGSGSSSMLMSLLPFIGIFFIFYFMVIRPQQTKAKQLKETMKSLRRGDKIITAGGIIATVVKNQEDSDEMEVDLANNVRVKVLKSTITTILESKASKLNEGFKGSKLGRSISKKDKKVEIEKKSEEAEQDEDSTDEKKISKTE